MFWTKQEDAILKKYFPTEGQSVANRLPGRSPGACANRAKRLDISTRRLWTQPEDAIIREFYPKEGGRVYLRLPGRNKAACHKRAVVLGVKSLNVGPRWSAEEDATLREVYPAVGPREAAHVLPGRSEEACKQRASALGLFYSKNNLPWTDRELSILKEFYPLEGSGVQNRLEGRSRDACIAMAQKLEIKYHGLRHAGFNPKNEFLQYMDTMIMQEKVGDHEFILSIRLGNGIKIPITLKEGETKGLLLTDNGAMSRLYPVESNTIETCAENFGISHENGMLSIPCELDNYLPWLQKMICCLSLIVAVIHFT